ncbi:MAG: DedA family protein [Bacteroidales bacterium]
MEIYNTLVAWYMEHMNYYTITLLMVIESSFIPFPSEAVIPPAAWKAAQGELNLFLVILFGTLGAIIGALANYYLAKSLGRMLVYSFSETRFARLCMITPEKVKKAEAYFIKNGNISTFIGRLIPGIRQLISIPAGLAKMPVAPFILYTALGAGIWNILLALLGYYLQSKQELFELYYKELSYGLLVLGILFVIWLVISAFRKPTKQAS